jgi:hypothetical protein
MRLETKFLRLSKPAELGDEIEGWQVCWLGDRPSTLNENL